MESEELLSVFSCCCCGPFDTGWGGGGGSHLLFLFTLQLLTRLLKSNHPEDLQAANRLIKNLVKEVGIFPLGSAEPAFDTHVYVVEGVGAQLARERDGLWAQNGDTAAGSLKGSRMVTGRGNHAVYFPSTFMQEPKAFHRP